jgi:uncharacterized protein (TIGR02001 family)
MIKSGLGVAGLVAATALAFSVPAKADELGYSITLGATSDYVFRGLSLSNEKPEAQGSIDFTYGQFYAGAWGSGVGVPGDIYNPLEIDLYAGWKPVVGQFNFDFGVIAYTYPSASNAGDYVEFKAAVSTEIVKSLTGGITFYYDPAQSNYGETYAIEGALAYALPQVGIFAPTVSGGLGYSENTDNFGVFSFFGNDEYLYWNAGLALTVEKLTMDFRYYDTDYDQVPGDLYTGLSDERFVFSAKVTLP